jgi:DNA-binding transcriptional LysR family regulator
VKLLERTNKRVDMTPVGSQILNHAQKALAEAKQMETVARAARDPLVGPLKLGVIPTLAPYLMPLILKPLRQAYPGLTIELWEDQTIALVDSLRNHRLDAALLATANHAPEITEIALFEEPSWPHCRRNTVSRTQNPFAKKLSPMSCWFSPRGTVSPTRRSPLVAQSSERGPGCRARCRSDIGYAGKPRRRRLEQRSFRPWLPTPLVNVTSRFASLPVVQPAPFAWPAGPDSLARRPCALWKRSFIKQLALASIERKCGSPQPVEKSGEIREIPTLSGRIR